MPSLAESFATLDDQDNDRKLAFFEELQEKIQSAELIPPSEWIPYITKQVKSNHQKLSCAALSTLCAIWERDRDKLKPVLGNIVAVVTVKLGDSHERTREQARHLLFLLSQHASTLAQYEKDIKAAFLSKQPAAKEQILLWLVDLYDYRNADLPLKPYMADVLCLLEDGSESVRDQAKISLLSIYKRAPVNVKRGIRRDMAEHSRWPQLKAQFDWVDEQLKLDLTEAASSDDLNGSGLLSPTEMTATDLQKSVDTLFAVFQEKESEENWADRDKAIDTLKSWLDSSVVRLDNFSSLFKSGIVPCLLQAMQSPRSQLSLKACKVVAEAAAKLTDFNLVAESLLQTALKLCFQTKKLVSNAGLETSIAILSQVQQSRFLPIIVAILNEKNKEAKVAASTMMVHIMKSWDQALLSKQWELIESFIRKAISDAAPTVRENAREVFSLAGAIFPEQTAHLVATADPTTKKQLQAQAKPSPPARQSIAQLKRLHSTGTDSAPNSATTSSPLSASSLISTPTVLLESPTVAEESTSSPILSSSEPSSSSRNEDQQPSPPRSIEPVEPSPSQTPVRAPAQSLLDASFNISPSMPSAAATPLAAVAPGSSMALMHSDSPAGQETPSFLLSSTPISTGRFPSVESPVSSSALSSPLATTNGSANEAESISSESVIEHLQQAVSRGSLNKVVMADIDALVTASDVLAVRSCVKEVFNSLVQLAETSETESELETVLMMERHIIRRLPSHSAGFASLLLQADEKNSRIKQSHLLKLSMAELVQVVCEHLPVEELLAIEGEKSLLILSHILDRLDEAQSRQTFLARKSLLSANLSSANVDERQAAWSLVTRWSYRLPKEDIDDLLEQVGPWARDMLEKAKDVAAVADNNSH